MLHRPFSDVRCPSLLRAIEPAGLQVNRKHKSLDSTGRVYCQYLYQWSRNSTLTNLLYEIQRSFKDDSPVHAVQQPAPVQQPVAQTNPYAGGVVPGYSQPPQQPQYGGGAAAGATNPYGGGAAAGATNPYGGGGAAAGATNPYQTNPYGAAGGAAARTAHNPYAQDAGRDIPPSYDNVAPETRKANRDESLDEDLLKMSIREELFRRLSQNLESMNLSTQGRCEAPLRDHNALRRGKGRLDTISLNLRVELSKVTDALEWYKEHSPKLAQSVAQLEEKVSGKLDVDDIIVAKAPLYTQILELKAQESALEDELYQMSQNIRRFPDVAALVRLHRDESRRLFMIRATLRKAKETARLD